MFVVKITLLFLIIILHLSCAQSEAEDSILSDSYLDLVESLLTEWTDAMVELQINNPEDEKIHGALSCPASNKIHGRCMDAVYPFMYMADKTKDPKYLNAAINVMEWSENVSMPDGSWTVIPEPSSWRGISVFGAIALAEALKFHGQILPDDVKKQWTLRLEKAAEFIYTNFDMTYSHVNYGFTSVYALHLLGEVLNEEKYTIRSRKLSKEIPDWLTSENKLIFGEDNPSNKRSAKGLLPIDLGYNVEESLNGAVLYALAEHDEELLSLLQKSMESHLEFMLPDGGWDNSWGSRQNKWTYWGSRTTDGCQPAFAMMAARNPTFGTAAFKNTELLQKATIDGLLSGGLHYREHGIKPCIHHTFTHAKSLAFILDQGTNLPKITKETPLPRSIARGIKHYEEIDVWVASNGPWTYTISSYDNVFKTEGSNQASGGSLSMLYHEKIGPLMCASMAKYMLVEKNNQQEQPGEEFALTPRLETIQKQLWYTNLYDLEAQVAVMGSDKQNTRIQVEVNLRNEFRQPVGFKEPYKIEYNSDGNYFELKVIDIPDDCTLVIPLISPSDENFHLATEARLIINKPPYQVEVNSNKPMIIKAMKRKRIFNMVPGVEVIPVLITLKKGESCNVKIQIQ